MISSYKYENPSLLAGFRGQGRYNTGSYRFRDINKRNLVYLQSLGVGVCATKRAIDFEI